MNHLEQKDLFDLDEKDLQIYFANTYLKVLTPKSGEFKYLFVDDINNAQSSVLKFRFITNEHGSASWFKVNDIKIEFDFPKIGFYSDSQQETVLYYRTSTRQFRKGINFDSHMMTSLFGFVKYLFPGHIRDYIAQTGPVMGLELLNTMFTQQDSRSVESKFQRILRGKNISQTLSLNFAVSLGVDQMLPTIWFRQFPVGILQSPTKIKTTNDFFRQELIDFFVPNQIEVV